VEAPQWTRRTKPKEATMPKLTDTQLVILSAAAARDDGAVLPLPDSLKIRGGAIAAVLKSLLKKNLVAERPAALGVEAWRENGDGGRVTLGVTDAGLQAIGITSDGEAATAKPASKKTSRSAARSKTSAKPNTGASPSVRHGTKQALLIDLLRAKNGAAIDQIVAATGWQAHSVRGAISGALKKKLGLTVISEAVEGRGRVYRIVEQQGAA
jgi:hypothetical protein